MAKVLKHIESSGRPPKWHAQQEPLHATDWVQFVGTMRMALFPVAGDWDDARAEAGLETSAHEDMHGGECETSILLHRFPELVRPGFEHADHLANDRRHLLSEGIRPYTTCGIIGRPSRASAEKGERLLAAFSRLFKEHLMVLRER